MRFDIIRQSLGYTAALVVMLLVLFWGRVGFYPLVAEGFPVPAGPFGTWLNDLVAPYDWLRGVLSCIVLFVNAFLVTRIVTRHMVLVVRTYQPALFYIIVSCGFLISGTPLAATVAAFFVIRGSELMISGFQRRPTYDKFFRAGLFLGFAPFFHAPAVVSLLMLAAGVFFFRRSWRETLIGTAAWLLPLSAYCYIGWMGGGAFDAPLRAMADLLTAGSGFDLWPDAGVARLAVMGLLAALTLLSLATIAIFAKQTRTRARRILYYYIWLLVVCAGCFLLPCRSAADWMLVAVPLAVVAPNCFVRIRGLVPTLVYLLLLLGVVGINLAPFLD